MFCKQSRLQYGKTLKIAMPYKPLFGVGLSVMVNQILEVML